MNAVRAWIACTSLAFSLPLLAAAADKPGDLSAEDKKYLEGLLQEFLFDPAGAQRVTLTTRLRTVWTSEEEIETQGWLVAGKDGQPARVFFTDGASINAPPESKLTKVDFVAACKARYLEAPRQPAEGRDEAVFRRMRQTAVGMLDSEDLAWAAWLHRLGQDDLAAHALAAARQAADSQREQRGDARQRLRSDLAWSAFSALVHAYMVRADEEALAHGERLLRLYQAEIKSGDLQQAPQIVAELKRRQQKGTLGKTPAQEAPEGFAGWDAARKTTWLLDALEEVDARQWGQPGGVPLAQDHRVEALIQVGDPAVPSLIDALERDERLTRSVHFWRDFARSRTVLSVREAVLTALMSILRVRVFEPAATGDNFTSRGDEGVKETVKALRKYWKEYGGLPFDERMMKVLTNPQANFEARREAAANLGTLTEDRRLGTTVFTEVRVGDAPRANPAVKKFSQPTAAEAIVKAMDADLAEHDRSPDDPNGLKDYRRKRIEHTYLAALVSLGDRRLAAEAARRAAAAERLRARRQWAQVAHDLGEAQPLKDFANDFRTGKIRPPAGDPQDRDENELRDIVVALVGAETAEAHSALRALSETRHPLHKVVVAQLLATNGGFDDGPWFSHPYCLAILRRALDDVTPTGATYSIEEDALRRTFENGWGSGGIPDFLDDPAVRLERAPERTCDIAATKLGELVVGLPRCHPLLKDSSQRLAAMKTAFDRFAGAFRLATAQEREWLGHDPWNACYVPDLRPLGRAATPEDVKAGKAIFHLNGKGRPLDLELPAVAVLKQGTGAAKEPRQPAAKEQPRQPDDHPPRAIIVQAEVDAAGKATYGILTRDAIRPASAADLTDIKTAKQLAAEAEAEVEKRKREFN